MGLVTGTCFAQVGHTIACVDANAEKIRLLKDGISPIYEPGLDEMIQDNVRHGRLSFSLDLAPALQGAVAAFIAVGTPEGEDGSADLKYVKAVAQEIGEKAQSDLVVVVKSTVPVGTGDMVEETIRKAFQARQVKFKFDVVSNPEFLKEGAAIDDFMRPDRIVVGTTSVDSQNVFREIYKPFVMDDPSKLLFMDRRSSELTKYGANAMLATRISFMNELSRLCEVVGADIDAIRRGMGMDERIGRKFLYAGPGYGGSCFPKDVAALQKTGEQNGVELSVLNAVSSANENQKMFAAKKISNHFGSLSGKTIAIWGLSFKPATDDVREAPAKTIIQYLLDKGAMVVAHDPQGQENFAKEFGDHKQLRYAKENYDALNQADALVLLTEWSEYRRPDWQRIAKLLRAKNVFDLRNQYDGAALIKDGFHFEAIGRPDSRVVRR